MTGTDRWRVAAALAASLLAHAILLSLVRMPPPLPTPTGVRFNLLLIPVPGERRAESAQAATPSTAAPAAAEGKKPAARERKAQAAASSVSEPARKRNPSVSAGPVSAPATRPSSQLADAADYLAPETLSAHPAFAAPFQMQFPRAAFEEGRRAVVVVQLLIDESGRVVEALAAPDAPLDFAEAALAGLRAARFRPAEAGGRPVKARAYFAVSFVLE